jgi:hypothetical protein
MKFFLNVFLFYCLLISFGAFAQQQPPFPKPPVKQDSINTYKPAMIDNEEINRIYVGCDNLYHFRGMTGKKLSALMGEQKVQEKNGFFILHVADTGKYVLSIYNDMTGGQRASDAPVKLLAEKIFEAVPLPEPSAMLANKSCGFISRNELLSADSVVVKSKRPTGNRVLSYKAAIVNSKSGRMEFESKNNRLTPEMKAAIRNAPAGTTVLFEYIRALVRVRGAGVSVNLPSVSFVLED